MRVECSADDDRERNDAHGTSHAERPLQRSRRRHLAAHPRIIGARLAGASPTCLQKCIRLSRNQTLGAPDHDAQEPARMTSGVLFALAIGTLVIFVLVGLMRRSRSASKAERSASDAQNTVAQWTEGETTRLLSSAEVPGLYLLRPRFLSKAENVVYLLLKAAFPRHEIFARVRLADGLQVKIGPPGRERLRAFRS